MARITKKQRAALVNEAAAAANGVAAAAAVSPRPSMRTTDADVTVSPVTWLVDGWLAYGDVALLAGESEVGKSTFAAAVAAHCAGGPELLGPRHGPPRAVLWYSAEEQLGRQVVPRLRAAELPRGWCIYPCHSPSGRKMSDLRLPSGMRGLSQVIAEEGAGLVFLDPITSWLDSDVTGGGDVAVRALIEQLQEVAAAQSCHVLFTRHDRKGRDGSAKDRVGGSGAWTQTPRTVIRLSEDAASPGCYRMVALKGQVDGRPPSRTYTLPRVGRIPRFAAGPVIDLTGLDLEDEVVGAMARSIVTDAENMIRYALEADDRASSVMHLRAQDEGISVAALRRAFLRLKPETYRVSHEGTWKLMWRKPAGGWPTTRSAD